MTIQAHPDDQEFGIGGTLAKWSKAGCGNYLRRHHQRRFGFERSRKRWTA
ncbi:MAG: hypothetical protein U0V48_10050 [Anaerolineales bacterium]